MAAVHAACERRRVAMEQRAAFAVERAAVERHEHVRCLRECRTMRIKRAVPSDQRSTAPQSRGAMCVKRARYLFARTDV